MLNTHPPESQVVNIWHTLLESGAGLVTDTGEPFRVMYPGRLNDTHGADMCDTVLVSRHGKSRGDIEFHVRAGDWYRHGHHRDPAYRNVILHVVLWNDTTPILNPDRALPTISLGRYLHDGLKRSLPLNETAVDYRTPCYQSVKDSPEKAVAFLDVAGAARFQAKAVRWQQLLPHQDAGQVLYRGIMEALGYTKNKGPFADLAERVPLSLLESIDRRQISDTARLAEQQALLMGTAGLLPSQRQNIRTARADDFAVVIEKAWHAAGRSGMMSSGSWNLYKVRPNNTPVRRLAGMSYLLLRYREKGLFKSLIERFENVPSREGQLLTNDLLVAADGYWLDHFDFGRLSPGPITGLIGTDRAVAIVVNVILPFMYALGRIKSDTVMPEKARVLYRAMPAGAGNAVERHLIDRIGLNKQTVGTACRRQGLIHIYQNFCVQGKCGECGLTQLKNQSSNIKTTV